MAFKVTAPQVKYVQAAPEVKYVQAAPQVKYVQSAPQVKYVQSAPQVKYVQSAPQVKYVQSAPQVKYVQAAPEVKYVQAAPVVKKITVTKPVNVAYEHPEYTKYSVPAQVAVHKQQHESAVNHFIMKRLIPFLASVPLVLCSIGTSLRFPDDNNNVCGYQFETSKDRILDFSWKFFKNVHSIAPNDENLILNPTTPQALLTTLARAAEGKTFDELCFVTNFNNEKELTDIFRSISSSQDKKNKNELSLASAILLNNKVSLHPQFLQSTNSDTYISNLDLTGKNKEKSIITVNQWASNITGGTIKELLSPTGQYNDLKILLASAVYFRSQWKEQFKAAGDKVFNSVNKGEGFTVPFMTIERNFRYGELENKEKQQFASWIELPYENERFSMIILLPEKNVTLKAAIDQLDFYELIKQNLLNGPTEVKVTMPKFQLRSKLSLVNAVQNMGIKSIFSQDAKLPLLLSNENAVVSDMIQEAFISVDEKGTKASAITTVNVITLSATYPDDTIQFFVDRPFLAIIFEKENGIPLFYAKVIITDNNIDNKHEL
uniref:CSON001337 protein n=1 Tax=Culicoides sonorensis TaxID=179676 RepID=A0A336K1A9_CULSO